MLGMWVMLWPLPAQCLLSGAPAGAATSSPPAHFALHSVYPRREERILNQKCRSNARFAFLLICPLVLSRKSRSSLVLPESQSVVAAGQKPELGARHAAGGFSWQHTLPTDMPRHVPFTLTTWPSHQTLQHHSQGCSWPLVTQETDGKCRSWWLERAVSRELPSSPHPAGLSSSSRMFTELSAGQMPAGPCCSMPISRPWVLHPRSKEGGCFIN